MLVVILNSGAALAAFAAAILWFLSAYVEVTVTKEERETWTGYIPPLAPSRKPDSLILVRETEARRSRWSQYAAIAAGISALLQAAALAAQIWL